MLLLIIFAKFARRRTLVAARLVEAVSGAEQDTRSVSYGEDFRRVRRDVEVAIRACWIFHFFVRLSCFRVVRLAYCRAYTVKPPRPFSRARL